MDKKIAYSRTAEPTRLLQRSTTLFRIVLAVPEALQWLQSRCQARILHVFKNSINLINEEGHVLSVVCTSLGPGPFTITVEPMGGNLGNLGNHSAVDFRRFIDVQAIVRVSRSKLEIGRLSFINNHPMKWDSAPVWHRLAGVDWPGIINVLEPNEIQLTTSVKFVSIPDQPVVFYKVAENAWELLSSGLRERHRGQCRAGAKKLAGLGGGLTPAGDDFLLGVIYALWAFSPDGSNYELIQAIVNEAAPRTTSLSAAWLRAAALGKAHHNWHSFFSAVETNQSHEMEHAVHLIRQTGHSSGEAALSGFISCMNVISHKCRVRRANL